jgi:hypothetical protein
MLCRRPRSLRAASRAVVLLLALGLGGGPVAASTYYVATNGLDSNNGSLGAPWASVGKAVSVVNGGDTVLIRGGTYRETVTIGHGGSSLNNPITYQAYPGEVPVISGANLCTSWTWDTNASPSAWKTPWTTSLASTTDTNFAMGDLTVLRPEMVVFNGQVLTAVGSRAALTNGSFYVDGPSTSPLASYVLFPGNASRSISVKLDRESMGISQWANHSLRLARAPRHPRVPGTCLSRRRCNRGRSRLYRTWSQKVKLGIQMAKTSLNRRAVSALITARPMWRNWQTR